MRNKLHHYKTVATALVALLLANGCVSTKAQDESIRQSEFEEAASEYLEYVQDGDHGIFSFEPFTSDFLGSYSDGLYTNDNMGFSVVIPEGFEPLSIEEIQSYLDACGCNIDVCDPDNDMLEIDPGACCDYRFENADGDAITFYYIETVGGSDDSLFFQYDVSLNVSRRTGQLENFYPEATITANTPVLIEFGNQWFYMLTFEIASDDSVTYLAELEDFLDNSQIDSFYSSVNRIISIEYSDPQDLENIMQGITFTLNGTQPNADYLEIAELVEFP